MKMQRGCANDSITVCAETMNGSKKGNYVSHELVITEGAAFPLVITEGAAFPSAFAELVLSAVSYRYLFI